MARDEKHARRDLSFHLLHRTLPGHLCAQDIDLVEYDAETKRPLALLEVALASKEYNPVKETGVLQALAGKRSYDLPAYVVKYLPYPDWRTLEKYPGHFQIKAFEIKRVWPDPEIGFSWVPYDDVYEMIRKIRRGEGFWK